MSIGLQSLFLTRHGITNQLGAPCTWVEELHS